MFSLLTPARDFGLKSTKKQGQRTVVWPRVPEGVSPFPFASIQISPCMTFSPVMVGRDNEAWSKWRGGVVRRDGFVCAPAGLCASVRVQ